MSGWTCSHRHYYTEFELECGMSYETMRYLSEVAEREYNLEADLETEAKLARAWALGVEECPWPWYAESPVIIVEPEIVG